MCSGLERDESSYGGEDLPVRRAAAVSLGAARSSSARRAPRRRKEDWDGTGSFEASVRGEERRRARLPTRGRARRRPQRRYGRRGTVSSTGGTLFARLKILARV